MGVMGYYWLMVNLFPIAQAALATAIQAGRDWRHLPEYRDDQQASFIMTEGLKSAYPMADQASWFERIWASQDGQQARGTGGSLVCRAGLPANMTHHMMMLIEYHSVVDVCCRRADSLGTLECDGSVGEFAVGWLTGGFIRALVSTAMLGIALPLLPSSIVPPKGLSPSTTR